MVTEEPKMENVEMDKDQNTIEETKKPNIFPLELLDMTIDEKVLIIMKEQQQFEGTLRGFDNYFNTVIDDY